MAREFFSIADIRIEVDYDAGLHGLALDRAARAFAVPGSGKSDIRIRIDTISPLPDLSGFRQLFTVVPDGLWTILESADRYAITLRDGVRDLEPYQVILADKSFSDFVMITRPDAQGLVYPLEYPEVEVMVIGHATIQRLGLLLHSACVEINGRGCLFTGVSGAGKSTISQLWQQDPAASVLTDERVVIREQGAGIWAHGTPWHGTAEIHRNAGAKLAAIFFITHGSRNRVEPLPMKEAVNRLLVRSFPTFWLQEGMAFAVDFCLRVVRAVPCYELEFLPDMSALAVVKGQLEGR